MLFDIGSSLASMMSEMFGKRFKLFTLFGFEVSIDPSWLVKCLWLG